MTIKNKTSKREYPCSFYLYKVAWGKKRTGTFGTALPLSYETKVSAGIEPATRGLRVEVSQSYDTQAYQKGR